MAGFRESRSLGAPGLNDLFSVKNQAGYVSGFRVTQSPQENDDPKVLKGFDNLVKRYTSESWIYARITDTPWDNLGEYLLHRIGLISKPVHDPNLSAEVNRSREELYIQSIKSIINNWRTQGLL